MLLTDGDGYSQKMAPPRKSEDSSLPMHIGQSLVDEMMRVNSTLGEVKGELGGVQSALGDLNGRVSQMMTRDECAAVMSGKRHPRPPSADIKKEHGWKAAHTRLGVILSVLALLSVCGGAFYWMASAYDTLKHAKNAIQSNGTDSRNNRERRDDRRRRYHDDRHNHDRYGLPKPKTTPTPRRPSD